MKWIYRIGSIMLLGIKLQFYFMIKTLMGGIIFGIFPAYFGVFKIINTCINERDYDHVYIFNELKKFDKQEFIKMNKIGYLFAIAIYLLVLNIDISRNFVHIRVLHWFILFILLLVISIFLYVTALFTKYDLPIKQYLIQGFLCSIIGILETIAIALGFSIAFGIAYVVPFLAVFLGIPMFMFAHAWFSRHTIARLENRFYKVKEEMETS